MGERSKVWDAERRLREGFTTTRRRFLGGAAGAGAMAAASTLGFDRLARADVPLPAGRAFLFCHFPGGWDQLMLLDPRDPARFLDAERARTLIELRYPEVEGVRGFHARLVRPSIPSPFVFGPLAQRDGERLQLTDLASRMAVLRGVNMSALGHETAYRYFLTATFPVGASARGSSVATEIAALMAPRVPARPLTNLSVRVESYNDRYPGIYNAVQVRNAEELVVVLAPGVAAEPDEVEAALRRHAAAERPCAQDVYDRRGLLSAIRTSRDTAEELVRGRVSRNFEFVSADTEAATRIRTQYGFARGEADHPGARAALAAQALKLGLSQVISVNIGNVTDTHFAANAVHASLLQPGLSAFLALMDDLRTSPHPEGGTFLDHTTVVGFSEFARTPLFNSYGGRDHHQASSVMLLGAGIRGNTLVGATSDVGMAPVPWDVTNNVPSDTGEILKPEHVAVTLLASAGLTSPRFRVSPIRAVLAEEPRP